MTACLFSPVWGRPEADDYDVATRTGWTVTVVGPSRLLNSHPSAHARVDPIAVQPGLVQGWRTTVPA